MHEHLAATKERLEVGLEALERAAEFSSEQVALARDFFPQRLGATDQLDIVVCGSMARQEMSGASDFDYLIVAHGLVEDPGMGREFRRACDDWCKDRGIKPPGPTGIFGAVVSATNLVEQIGLEFDTNHSLTRRVLLLEEGVSVYRPELHRRFVEVVLSRYLHGEHLDDLGVPRFLFNDMARYWRTIAVDYQAKVWERLDTSGWGLRYLKLRVSRKLTFAGSLVPLLLVALRHPEDVGAFLTEQYVDLPPLARLAQLASEVGDDAAALEYLGRILESASSFVGFLADETHREEIDSIQSPGDSEGNESFEEMQQLSSALQGDLEGLFLDSQAFGKLGRKYLTF